MCCIGTYAHIIYMHIYIYNISYIYILYINLVQELDSIEGLKCTYVYIYIYIWLQHMFPTCIGNLCHICIHIFYHKYTDIHKV